MKRIIYAAIISLATVLCVSATAKNELADNYSSSVSVTIAGVDGEIDFDTKTLVAIYNLMPQKVKNLCVAGYWEIAPMIEKCGPVGFAYEGVTIVPIRTEKGTDLKFSAQGHSIVVKNYSRSEFETIFAL
ncbi:MAG: hypothetical protein ACI3ZL_04250 [Candidatus Cryptobacteroides sp.]